MKTIAEMANRLTEIIDEAEDPYELASVVEQMIGCYSTPVIIAALISEIVVLKGMCFEEDEDGDEDEVDFSFMA